jgi:hypothetical protein
MKVKKARKARGVKLNGRMSEDMCSGCYSFMCDPGGDSKEWSAKKHKRYILKVCIACGSNPCKCKSTLDLPLRKNFKELTSVKNSLKSN